MDQTADSSRPVSWTDAIWLAAAFGLCAALFNWVTVFLFDWWDPPVATATVTPEALVPSRFES
jgi:hypothetical protein